MTEFTTFKPGAELTFKSVISVRSKLFDALLNNKSKHFCLDLTEVLHCDSAGLALLIEAKKLCKQGQKVFEVKGMSSEMHSLAKFCGVERLYDVPDV